jgi:hypothetical protein
VVEVTVPRTPRARRSSTPARQPANGQPPRVEYPPVLPGLVACSRCAALLVDAEAPKATHARFHDGLRQLWERQ